MDRIENAPATPETRTPRREGSQSKLPPILLAIVAAAVVLRIVTGLTGREKAEAGPGLIHWVSQQKAASAARSDSRPVLYDFTAAWCAPCHRLDSEGWSDPEIAALVNGSYEPARVVDREREDGRNSGPIEELQRRYAVTAFPTLIVASPDGLLMAKYEGYGGKERLRRFLEEARHQSPRPPEPGPADRRR